MIRYISADQLAARYGVNRSTIWRWASARNGTFPKPVKLGEQTTRWKLEDVERYDAEREGVVA